MPLVDLSLNFIYQTDYDVIMTSFKFSPNNAHISNSIEHTNFIFGTNTQQHDVHMIIKVKVTLTDDEAHS